MAFRCRGSLLLHRCARIQLTCGSMLPGTSIRAQLRARISQVHPGFPEHLRRTGRGMGRKASAPKAPRSEGPGASGLRLRLVSCQSNAAYAWWPYGPNRFLRQCRRLWQFRDRLRSCVSRRPAKCSEKKNCEVRTFAVSTSGSTGAAEVLFRANSCTE